jgi:tRNA pseudouridine55 synthase
MSRVSSSPASRSLDGIFLLDKSSGITSNAALQKVKRLLNARKAGHTGSLDPLASGLLPICLGEATKLSSFLLANDKRYRVVVQLGQSTTTGDAEGEPTSQCAVPDLDREIIQTVLERYVGELEQLPPMYSALRQDGVRLYELARKGIEVDRKPRRITIHALRLMGFTESSLDLDVHCSKGTYIRVLAEDIGRDLGCGGHVKSLRRTHVGDLRVEDAYTLREVETLPENERLDRVLPMDRGVAGLPAVQLDDELVYFLQRGQAVRTQKAPTRGWVKLYARTGRFFGIGEVLSDGKLAPRRLIKSTGLLAS